MQSELLGHSLLRMGQAGALAAPSHRAGCRPCSGTQGWISPVPPTGLEPVGPPFSADVFRFGCLHVFPPGPFPGVLW